MKKTRLILIISIIVIGTLTSGCNSQKKECEKSAVVMGTVITAKVYDDNANKAVQAVIDKTKEIEAVMSAKLEDSELSYVNDNALNDDIKISDELYNVIDKSIYYSELSDGAYDPTIGKLIDMWGIGSGNEKVLSTDEVSNYIGLNNYQNIILNKENRTVRFDDERIKLDLGGIVKGYTADVIKQMLIEEYGVDSAIISLGGNIITVGVKEDGSKWSVGIQSPTNDNELIKTLRVGDISVVTAGNYERYFEKDGVRYHHIIDPLDGYPADNGIISSSIITKSSTEADALSTATFILGVEKATKLINSLEDVKAIFVNDNGEISEVE